MNIPTNLTTPNHFILTSSYRPFPSSAGGQLKSMEDGYLECFFQSKPRLIMCDVKLKSQGMSTFYQWKGG
jgi:hypothetical protein